MPNFIINTLSFKEVNNSTILKIIYYIFILNSIIFFFDFETNSLCWPHFQNCKDFLSFTSLPFSYNLNYFTVYMFGWLIAGTVFFYKKEYSLAWLSLFFVFIFRVYFTFFDNYNSGNFNYYDIYLMFIYLFLPKKELFLKVTFVWLYFLSSTIKLDESFILAKYFTTLKLGAPIFDNYSIVILSNVVILMQMVGAWFLFSKNQKIRTLVYIYMTVFHFYSGFLVGYRYIITSVPFLIILFNKEFHSNYDIKSELNNESKKNIPGILFLFFLLILQTTPYTLEGNHKITLEGNNYGLYMFEANHQCKSEVWLDNKVIKTDYSNDARSRCDPYVYLKKYKYLCGTYKNKKIQWSLISSINGGAFYEIVRTEDLCNLEYKPFTKNNWIKDEKQAIIIGYPTYNYYISSFISPAGKKDFISKSPRIQNNVIQNYLEKQLNKIKLLYLTLYISTLLYLVYFLYKK